jgi:hypothetical protein
MPLSRQRLDRNQVIFREVNERLREVADAVPDGKARYLCECSDVQCTQKIELRLFEYEAVRARANAFFIVPGHQRPEVERVVEETDEYMIVGKIVPIDDLATRALTSTGELWPAHEL